MKNNIQKEIQERREHAERLKKIALKLFEQLKSEKIDFSDAERIVSMLSASASRPACARRTICPMPSGRRCLRRKRPSTGP